MIARLDHRATLRLLVRLWPLWFAWPSWRLSAILWRVLVLQATRPTDPNYPGFFQLWPTAALAGPILTMGTICLLYRGGVVSRLLAIASFCGVALATVITMRFAWGWVHPYLAGPLRAFPPFALGYVYAVVAGLFTLAIGYHWLWGDSNDPLARRGVRRGASDNFGHADWLSIEDARRLYPGPDPRIGGIVIGEAYRVDRDRVARRRFEPDDRASWGRGGTAPLLIDPCRDGSTHGLVIAGSGGFKTSGTGIPTLLHWRSSAVVLDPSREIGPMVGAARIRNLGQRVVTLDPSSPGGGSFNALDWIDPTAPDADTNVEAVATWLAGEPGRGGGSVSGGAEFFRDMGRQLIACLLADMLWDRGAPDRTLRALRARLVTPEQEMRTLLEGVHATSASGLARDYAGTLKGLVEETFSGVYANAAQATRWLSTESYAALVSGDDFRTADLAAGNLTIFVQISLKTLEASPGFGRVVIGSLLNAAYEADGAVHGRILFLLDEVARLGPMRAIEVARDAGRKYGLTLLLLYQSVGQLIDQWGKEGARAWYDSVSWRLYAAVCDPETARELSGLCGDYAVIAASRGDTSSTQSAHSGNSASSGQSSNLSEMQRALIKPDELLHDVRTDEAFVIRRGARPLRCGRAIWFRRPDMRALVADSRFHR